MLIAVVITSLAMSATAQELQILGAEAKVEGASEFEKPVMLQANGKPIETLELASADQVKRCHLAFIGASQRDQLGTIQRAAAGKARPHGDVGDQRVQRHRGDGGAGGQDQRVLERAQEELVGEHRRRTRPENRDGAGHARAPACTNTHVTPRPVSRAKYGRPG